MSPGRSERLSRTSPAVQTIDTLATATLTVASEGEGFVDITEAVREFLVDANAVDGQLTLFLRHTSASLTIQENADPDVLGDLITALRRLAPQDGGWRHDAEGPDDMPAHIRAMLTSSALQVPVQAGRLLLGTWQALYLIEHRARPHRREVVMQFIGTDGKSIARGMNNDR